MNRRVRHLIAPLVAMAMLALATTAGASPGAVLQDCSDGALDGNYSDADKRAALDQIPADVDEYTECRAIIGGSINGPKAGASSASGGPAGATAKTPRARRAAARKALKVREARRQRAREVRERKLGPRAVDPRDAGVLKAANTANGMPLSVALAVAALALLAIAGGAFALWRQPRFADALRRVTPPRFRR